MNNVMGRLLLMNVVQGIIEGGELSCSITQTQVRNIFLISFLWQ